VRHTPLPHARISCRNIRAIDLATKIRDIVDAADV